MIVVQPKIHNSFHIIFRNILDDGLKFDYTQKIQSKHFYFETFNFPSPQIIQKISEKENPFYFLD
jgi:hypothetical protein